VVIRWKSDTPGPPIHPLRRARRGSMDAARNGGRPAAKIATIKFCSGP
jgi:hypothetical protein